MKKKIQLLISTVLVTTSFLTFGAFAATTSAESTSLAVTSATTTPLAVTSGAITTAASVTVNTTTPAGVALVYSDVDAVSRHIEATSDGGSIICGNGVVDGVSGLYIAKLDSDGNKNWEKVITNAGVGQSVQETSNNCYIAVSSNKHVVKLDSNGNLLWDKVLSGAAELNSIEPTSDGNFIICGSCTSSTSKYNVYLCKIDANCNIIFSRSIGTANNDFGEAVRQTADGGYIVLGMTLPSTSQYMYLVKVDKSGNLLWAKTVGATGGDGKDIKVTADGSFIIAGSIAFKGALLKTNSSGTLLWSRILNDWSIDGIELDTDGFMLTGNVKGSDFSTDIDQQVIKTDLSGNKVWDYKYKEYNSVDYARAISKDSDGSFLIIGDTQNQNGTGKQHITFMKDSH